MAWTQPPTESHATNTPVIVLAIVVVFALLVGLGLVVVTRPGQAPRAAAGPPFSYRNLPFPVTNLNVVAGQEADLLIDRCNHTQSSLTYVVTRTLTNVETGDELSLGALDRKITEVGCALDGESSAVIPVRTPAGRYYLTLVASIEDRGQVYTAAGRSAIFSVVAP